VGVDDKKSTVEKQPEAWREKVIRIQEFIMKHSLTIVGLDDRIDVARMSCIENPRPGIARRTVNAPIRLVRRFDRIERRPRKPPACLV
jgi:hypothetical protein